MNTTSATKCPGSLKYWTLDEAAECLPVTAETSACLWRLMPASLPPEGEWPEPDSDSRKGRFLSSFWSKLTPAQQDEIVEAAKKEGL